MRSLLLRALVLLVTGCTRSQVPAAQEALTLEPCRLRGVPAQAHCGTLEVFEDRARREGRKLKLHVAVLPALASDPAPDPVFVLAGGPGQAASDVAPVLFRAMERVRRSRDLVFVDQRGTGRSAKLSCELEPEDASLSEQLQATFDPKAITRCVDELSKDHDLRLYGTTIAMDDLEEVRAALGYERINLWGGSYGTRAALVYMRRYPERVRTAILDGVAPLQLVLPRDMAADADRALRLLFEHCGKDEACRSTWPDLAGRFAALRASLDRAPAQVTAPHPVTGRPEEVTITRDAFVRTLRAVLYQPEATSLVPFTIHRASEGDFRPLIAQADQLTAGFAEGLAIGMFFSVVCTEDVPFLDPAAVRAAGEGTFVGPGFAEEILEACALWPRGEVPEDFREPVRSDVPVLLLSGELDPVTPPRWAEAAMETLTRAKHVSVPATGHGTLGNACVRRLMEKFLARGSVDGLDETCADATRPPFFTTFAGPPP